MRQLLFFLLFLALSLPAHAGEGCTCRATDGSKVAEGATACIKSAKGMTMARCERVLNNTSWKFLDTPCPAAGLPPGVKLPMPARV